MLEQKDLQAIAELIDARAIQTEEKLSGKIDTLEKETRELSVKVGALEETTGELSVKVGALEETTGELSVKVGALEEITGELGEKINTLEERISEVERTLVDELVRTEDRLTKKIERIEKNIEELNQYYRINKLENGNTGLILQILEGYQKRLEALERKVA